MARGCCEEWMPHLRYTLSGERSCHFVGDLGSVNGDGGRKSRSQFMTVEVFHRIQL